MIPSKEDHSKLSSINSRSIISKQIKSQNVSDIYNKARNGIKRLILELGYEKAPKADDIYYGKKDSRKEYTKIIIKQKTIQINPRNPEYIPYYDTIDNDDYYQKFNLDEIYADYLENGKNSLIYKLLSKADLASDVKKKIEEYNKNKSNYQKLSIPKSIVNKGNRKLTPKQFSIMELDREYETTSKLPNSFRNIPNYDMIYRLFFSWFIGFTKKTATQTWINAGMPAPDKLEHAVTVTFGLRLSRGRRIHASNIDPKLVKALKSYKDITYQELKTMYSKDYITLYRGINDKKANKLIKEGYKVGDNVDAIYNLTSWTESKDIAINYAKGEYQDHCEYKDGIVIKAIVPISQILSHWKIRRKYLGDIVTDSTEMKEEEVMVMGHDIKCMIINIY